MGKNSTARAVADKVYAELLQYGFATVPVQAGLEDLSQAMND